MKHPENRMAPALRRGRPPLAADPEWKAPEPLPAGAPCWCGAAHDRLRVYGSAKAADGTVRWRYVRCLDCGRKHTLRP